MKRSRFTRRTRQTPDTEELIRLTTQLSLSGSRLEDEFWERRLAGLVERLLAGNDEAALNAALDHLYGAGGRAYDELADMVESCAECRHYMIESAGADQDVLLFAAPVLAWSRYAIPSGQIPADVLASLRVQLQAHVLAANVRFGLADFFYSPDQLPQSYSDTAALTEKLTKSALHGRDLKLDPAQMPETINFLSDTRYLIGVLCAPAGGPLFRWQEEDGNRTEAHKQWRGQGGEALRPLLPACALEPLLPQSFHAAVREADRASRPYSLRSAVSFLQTTLNVNAANLHAVVAPYYDRQLEEFRIGFTVDASADVVHGVVWPLLENEDEAAETPGQIEAVLREAGVAEVLVLDHRFPLEYCDDCGAPLYPNPDGEPVHAELPEQEEEAAPRHLH
ncbi:MAG: DUF2863 family protein [Rhodocyclaceae bacterium]|nr:DUF2863 family protein [Rhodocyclaceae bacterium]MDP2108842.1 DUF2863 family protein [Rhodocyclaceae bacterium]MDP2195844.1 DUF2863 family protein [Rhodocyclaceae bacterium]MDP3037905.1 DUF2863 family protein [Rhodocyclaceae bacterium]